MTTEIQLPWVVFNYINYFFSFVHDYLSILNIFYAFYLNTGSLAQLLYVEFWILYARNETNFKDIKGI